MGEQECDSDSSSDACAAAQCQACGQPFACGATLAGCWCAEIELSAAARAEIGARYQRCLCRACLESFAANIPPTRK